MRALLVRVQLPLVMDADDRRRYVLGLARREAGANIAVLDQYAETQIGIVRPWRDLLATQQDDMCIVAARILVE